LDSLGRSEEALASYDKSLKLNPDNHTVWHKRGIALGNLRRYEEAIASCDQSLKLRPSVYQELKEKQGRPLLGFSLVSIVSVAVIFKIVVLIARMNSTPDSSSSALSPEMQRAAQQGMTFSVLSSMQAEWGDYLIQHGQPPESTRDLKQFMGNPVGKEHFTYKLIPQLIDRAKQKPLGDKAIIAGAAFIATPKLPELSGVTGVIYYRQNRESLTLICAADDITSKPPIVPKPPTTVDDTLECPAGSSKMTTYLPQNH
jgi:tetratricopeptide (TPR) repeat protein